MSDWELVLRGGRVIDPESGLDAVRDVAVGQGRIAAIGTGLPPAPVEVDVAGQVVTAGFIDLHSHVSDLGGLRLQAMDGVTTALELEAGVTPVADAYRHAALQGRPVNYGFSASWALARMEAVAGLPPDASLGALMARISDPAWQRPAEAAQVTALPTWPTEHSASASCLDMRPPPARRSTCGSLSSPQKPACPPLPTRVT